MKRRDFLKAAAISTAALAADRAVSTGKAQELSDSNAAQLPRRPYGDTGIELSIISFGGIVVMNADAEHASQVVGEAVERGVNYFDVAPSYGNAEEKLGPALEPYRKDVFLACKTGQRTAEGAQTEFDRSLELLRTDHFDLYATSTAARWKCCCARRRPGRSATSASPPIPRTRPLRPWSATTSTRSCSL